MASPIGEKADDSAVKLVELFLKTSTADLPPERVPDFIAIDPDTLPKKLQSGYRSKKEELLALKKVADGRKKTKIRRKDASAPAASSCAIDPPQSLATLKLAGYVELDTGEDEWLQRKVRCSECELMTEFTLRKVSKPKVKNQKTAKQEYVYLLHGVDILWGLIKAHRQGMENPFGTAFFGDGGTPRCH